MIHCSLVMSESSLTQFCSSKYFSKVCRSVNKLCHPESFCRIGPKDIISLSTPKMNERLQYKIKDTTKQA